MNRSITFFIIVISLVSFSGCSNKLNDLANQYSNLNDGIYLVKRDGSSARDILPLQENEMIVRFNKEFLDKTDQKNRFVVLEKGDFVPILLDRMPQKLPHEGGRNMLMLHLDDPSTNHLRKFTDKNLNKLISIVIGGEALTIHKVRSVIEGGQLQITRCTDNACELLFIHLKNNIVTVED